MSIRSLFDQGLSISAEMSRKQMSSKVCLYSHEYCPYNNLILLMKVIRLWTRAILSEQDGGCPLGLPFFILFMIIHSGWSLVEFSVTIHEEKD